MENINMENTNMEITIGVEGMMCGHCEARVKKALEALSFVDEAVPNHEENKVVLKLNAEADLDAVKKAVEDQDYKYI